MNGSKFINLRNILDVSINYAAPVASAIIAGGLMTYGFVPSNWQNGNPLPMLSLLAGGPGFIGSLAWIKMLYSDRTEVERITQNVMNQIESRKEEITQNVMNQIESRKEEIQRQSELESKAEQREAQRQSELRAEEERKAAPKFIYQFETKPMTAEAAESWIANIQCITNSYSGKIFTSNLRTYSTRKTQKDTKDLLDEKNLLVAPERYISGVIVVCEEESAREMAGTVESILPMQKRALTYRGKSIDDNILEERK